MRIQARVDTGFAHASSLVRTARCALKLTKAVLAGTQKVTDCSFNEIAFGQCFHVIVTELDDDITVFFRAAVLINKQN